MNVAIDFEMLKSIDDFMIDIKRACYQWLDLHPADRVLDAGCGLGLDTQRIRRFEGMDVAAVGIDSNLDLARRSWPRLEMQDARFVAADAATLPFRGDTFDAVWSDRLLQHVDDPLQVISEFKRVLRPDGRLLLADSDHTSARLLCNDKACGQKYMSLRAKAVKWRSAGRDLQSWCRQSGLEVLSARCIDVDINNLELATRLGLFFGGWDEQIRSGGRRQANELARFLARMQACDRQKAFRYTSQFHMVLARRAD